MADEWAKTTKSSSKSPSRFQRLEAASARRRHLFTVEQATAAGIPASSLRSRAAAGRIHRVFRGVYCFVPPPYEPQRLWLAAVLACGPEALLSDLPAAALCGLFRSLPRLHVTVPADGPHRLGGIVIHRRSIARCDRLIRHGIPCTSAARTIFDLAASMPESELEPILVQADSLRILNRRRLDELVAENPGHRGVPKLRPLLASDPIRVRSEVELDFTRLCRRAEIDAPQVNQRITVAGRSIEVDFSWPERKIVVEVDGYAFHGGRSRANADCDRDQQLAITGWRVIRFTADQIRDDPDEIVRRLRLLFGDRSAG
jgi:very-short-patch-repair endonuclease